jgi:transposase
MAASLSKRQIAAALRRSGRERGIDALSVQIHAALQVPQLRQPSPLEDAMAMQALALLGSLNTECASTETLGQAVIAAFQQHPDHPIITSFPGLGDLTGARILGEIGHDRERFADARALKAFTVAPVTVPDRRLISEPATASSRQSLRTCWFRRCRPTLAGSHRAGRVPKELRDSRLACVSSIEVTRRRYRALVEWPLRWMMSERRTDAPGISFVDDSGLDRPRRQVQGSAPILRR